MSSEWPLVRLGDLASIRHGWPFKSEFFQIDGAKSATLPIVVAIGNFEYTGGFRFHSTQIKRYSDVFPSEYILKPGDILLVMTCQTAGGEILGIPAKIPDDGQVYLHNQRLGLVAIRSDALFPGFAYWLFLAQAFNRHLVGSATGTKILHTAPSRIESFHFRLPPLSDQISISAMLSALDDRIILLRETNVTFEAIAQTLFKSWFVDFDPVRAKMEGRTPEGMDEATAALFPDALEQTELGLVPKGWHYSTIGQLADVIDCLHSKKPELLGTGRPFLQLNNIRNDGLLDTSALACISESDYAKWTSRIEVCGGDCVITNVGRVGAVAQIPDGFRAAMGRNMTAIRLKPEWPYPTYLIELLQSPWMSAEIESKTDVGTILNALNVKSIPRLRCLIAPHAVMNCFEQAARPLRAAMEGNLHKAHTLATLRDTLLPRLISGQLRLPEFMAELEAA